MNTYYCNYTNIKSNAPCSGKIIGAPAYKPCIICGFNMCKYCILSCDSCGASLCSNKNCTRVIPLWDRDTFYDIDDIQILCIECYSVGMYIQKPYFVKDVKEGIIWNIGDIKLGYCDYCDEYNELLNCEGDKCEYFYSDRKHICKECTNVCKKCENNYCNECWKEIDLTKYPCISHRHCSDCLYKPNPCNVYPMGSCRCGCGDYHYSELIWRSKEDKLTWKKMYDKIYDKLR